MFAESTVKEWARQRPDAASTLSAWFKAASEADWQSIGDVRKTYPSADGVTVASGNIVTVFNIGGNKYRLITAIHYNRRHVYLLRFLTHAEYDKNKWKAEL